MDADAIYGRRARQLLFWPALMLEIVLQSLELGIVTVGVVGGLYQLRLMRTTRERESALELLRSFMSPEVSRAMNTLFSLPDGLNLAGLKRAAGDRYDDIYYVSTAFESIGVLVHRGELDIHLVDDFYSGPILLFWRKCGPAMKEIRAANGRETIAEWCEWLADRLAATEAATPAVPAFIAHKDWSPKSQNAGS